MVRINKTYESKRNDFGKGRFFDACVSTQLGWPHGTGGLG